jgi:hypothetical protein
MFRRPELDNCSRCNLAFKAILILDKAPGHPQPLQKLCKGTIIASLPPNIRYDILCTARAVADNVTSREELSGRPLGQTTKKTTNNKTDEKQQTRRQTTKQTTNNK